MSARMALPFASPTKPLGCSAITIAEITAVHESAHAVGYLYYGLRHGGIRLGVDQDGDLVGKVTSPAGRYDPHARAVICLAGPASEEKLTGISLFDQLGSRRDVEMAEEALSRIGASDFDLVVPFTRALVKRQWPAIVAIADALLRAGALTYDETRLVARARVT